jgi:adenylate cyclase
MQNIRDYLPVDRYLALQHGLELSARASGAFFFADISGFTPLTQQLVEQFGKRQGVENLLQILNTVYSAVVEQIHARRGSIVAFSGDAVLVWFGTTTTETNVKAATHRAVTAAFGVQEAVARQAIELNVQVSVKIGVASGELSRLKVGGDRLFDVLAGAALEDMNRAEKLAQPGEIVATSSVAKTLTGRIVATGEKREKNFVVLDKLKKAAPLQIWEGSAATPEQNELLRRWLLPAIYERLQAGQGAFLTELRPAVAVFLNFPLLDYDNDPDVEQKLDTFTRYLQNSVAEYDGTVLELVTGDKGNYFYIVFGAPAAHENEAERALRALLDIREKLPQQSGLEWARDLRIGVSQGLMRAGAYGGAGRVNYGVLGSEVNLAARLMQAAQPGQILVSEAAYRPVEQRFEWEFLPPLLVKGRAETVNVANLLQIKEQTRLRLTAPEYTLPMVGRVAELEIARRKIAETLQGRGQVLTISGEAGLGKTRFVTEIIKLADAAGMILLGGEAQSYGTNSAYLAWHSIWRGFFDLQATDTPAEQYRKVEEKVTRLAPEKVTLLPVLDDALGLAWAENDFTRNLDGKIRKTAREGLLADCLRNAHEPLMLVLEDCHWLDALSRELVEQVAALAAEIPLMLVLAYRPPEPQEQFLPGLFQLPHVTKIELNELNEAEAGQLIELKLGQLQATPEIITALKERADGNPFYLEELINYLQDLNVNLQTRPNWQKIELPDTLQSLIISRLDTLTEKQRITVKVASVLGRVFEARWLWGYYPGLGAPDGIREDLDYLARVDLVPLSRTEPELEYLFKHIVTRDVAYESLAYSTRATLHEQFAAYLERANSEQLEQYVDLLAYHYARTENLSKKKEYLHKAGFAARAAYANQAAIDYFGQLLPLLDDAEKPEVLFAQAHLADILGSWDVADRLYLEFLELATRLDDKLYIAKGNRGLGVFRRRQGKLKEALPILETARDQYEKLNLPIEHAQTQIEIGEIALLTGDFPTGETLFQKMLPIFEAHANPQGMAVVAHRLGNLYFMQARYPEADAKYRQALAIRQELNDNFGSAPLIQNIGLIALRESRFETAKVMLEEALVLRHQFSEKMGISHILHDLGLIYLNLYDFKGAKRLLEDSLKLRREMGDRRGIVMGLNNLARMYVLEGDYTTALAMYEESIEIGKLVGDIRTSSKPLLNLATLYCYKGEHRRAAGYLAESVEIQVKIDDKDGIVECTSGLVVAAEPLGYLEDAARLAAITARILDNLKSSLAPGFREFYAGVVTKIQEGLGDARYNEIRQEVYAQTDDEVIRQGIELVRTLCRQIAEQQL